MKPYFLSISIVVILLLPSCNTNRTNKMEQELTDFIKHYEKTFVSLYIEANKAWYDAAVSGKKEDYDKAANLAVKLSKYYTNKTDFAQLKKLKESGLIKDSILGRELDLLYLNYLGNQADTVKLEEGIRMQSKIENTFAAYRAEVGSKKLSDNQVDSILRNSTSSAELEEVWKASKKIGEVVSPDLIVLVKKRNEIAKELGYSNYQEMSLKLSEEDPKEIEALFDELDNLTREAFTKLKGEIDAYLSKRFSMPTSKLMPWHYQNRFFQEAPAIYSVGLDGYYKDMNIIDVAEKYYKGLGLPIDDIIARSDL